jgi:hypothetical protein
VTVVRGRTRRRHHREDVLQSFYESALSAAEREDLPHARDVEGLDEEIAVLRLRLRSVLQEHPDNMKLMLKGIELLTRALSARYRLSKDAKADLSASIKSVLSEIGGRIYPEGLGDIAANESK